MLAARRCAQELVANAPVTRVADISKTLWANRDLLLSLDQCFHVELNYVHSVLPGLLEGAVEETSLHVVVGRTEIKRCWRTAPHKLRIAVAILMLSSMGIAVLSS